MQIVEYKGKQKNSVTPEKYDELIKKLRKEHERPIKGIFEFVDAQGGWLEFTYRFFKGDPLIKLKLMHGEIVELPLGIVRHLNNTKKKIRTMNPNIDVKTATSSYNKISRVKFTPLELEV